MDNSSAAVQIRLPLLFCNCGTVRVWSLGEKDRPPRILIATGPNSSMEKNFSFCLRLESIFVIFFSLVRYSGSGLVRTVLAFLNVYPSERTYSDIIVLEIVSRYTLAYACANVFKLHDVLLILWSEGDSWISLIIRSFLSLMSLITCSGIPLVLCKSRCSSIVTT